MANSYRSHTPWDGTWIAVEHSGLKRSDRTAARRHDQALRLAGSRVEAHTRSPTEQSPRGTGSARRTLHRLGAASESAVMEIAHLAPEDDSTIRTLWNSEALLADIAEAREALTQAQTRLATISREEAARESLALGSAVIAVIVRNPLLPEELEPTQPLRELISHMLEYQDASRELWQSLLEF